MNEYEKSLLLQLCDFFGVVVVIEHIYDTGEAVGWWSEAGLGILL